MKESLIYYSVKSLAALVRFLPLSAALSVGRMMGLMAYLCFPKKRKQVHANLKTAFADSKSPEEIKKMTKRAFQKFGLNFIDLFRMPLMTPERFQTMLSLKGEEHIKVSHDKGRGVILLAMHFGSWEMGSLICSFLDYPYKVFVKHQPKFSRLNELLNSYRMCGGSVVLSRGMGTRDFIKSLKQGDIIGMVVDQGGRNGVNVPFFGREASMSSGGIRMGMKFNIPICFSVIHRNPDGTNVVTIHDPLELDSTGDYDADVRNNLQKLVKLMEKYIAENPEDYMWFYKVWKYSSQARVTILSDGKMGHQRQSESMALAIKKAYEERDMTVEIDVVPIEFKSSEQEKMFRWSSIVREPFLSLGKIAALRKSLTAESFKKLAAVKSDVVISCGSSMAPVNRFLSQDLNAKSVVIQKPGLHAFKKFDLVALPYHDTVDKKMPKNVVVTNASPNVISQKYIEDSTEGLLNHFSHLKGKVRLKIGVFIGGDSKNIHLSEALIRRFLRQLREASNELNADLLITTSRRTPNHIEQLLIRKMKKDPRCPLLIIPNRESVDEAVGGIMGLSDILIVSGDSLSMVSEAASSGKKTIVFSAEEKRDVKKFVNKHKVCIDQLNEKGFIISSSVKDIGRTIYDIAKNKIQTRTLDDNDTLLQAARKVI